MSRCDTTWGLVSTSVCVELVCLNTCAISLGPVQMSVYGAGVHDCVWYGFGAGARECIGPGVCVSVRGGSLVCMRVCGVSMGLLWGTVLTSGSRVGSALP